MSVDVGVDDARGPAGGAGVFNRGVPFDPEIAARAAKAIAAMYLALCAQAEADGELERFFSIEVPVYRTLQAAMSAGIAVDPAGLSEKRSQAEHDYFVLLKDYSHKHDMPLETPSRAAIEARLLADDFDLDQVSIEYVLEFVPHGRHAASSPLSFDFGLSHPPPAQVRC